MWRAGCIFEAKKSEKYILPDISENAQEENASKLCYWIEEIEIHFLKKKAVWKGNVPDYNTLVNHMERTLSIPPSVPKPYKWLCKIPDKGTFRVIADKKTYEKNAEFFMSKCQLATLVKMKNKNDRLDFALSCIQ